MKHLTIGEGLRRAREAKGASLFEAARETKIRVDFLESMERDAFNFLNAGPYVKGMLRSYSAWLGLDAAEVVEYFERTYGAQTKPVATQLFKEPVQRPPKPRQKLWLTASVVAASFLLALSLIGVLNPPSTDVATPGPVPESAQPDAGAPPDETIAQAPAPAVEGVDLRISIVGDRCWVSVFADDAAEPMFEGTLTNGVVESFNAAQKIRVTFGKLSAVRVAVNGVDLGTPVGAGETGTYVFYPDTTGFTSP